MGSFPVISTPCIGHEHVPEVCRIHPASQTFTAHDNIALTPPWSDPLLLLSDLDTPAAG